MATVTASSGSRTKLRSIAVALIMTLSILVLAAGPARADCDVLDVTCVVETADDTTDEVVETVDEVVETVDEVVETVEGTVDEVVETVEGTVDEVVETVEGTVDEVVETVDGTVDEVVETVDGTVDEVVETVDETVEPVAPIQPAPGETDPPGENPGAETGTSLVRPDSGGSRSLVGSALLEGSGPLGPVGFIGVPVPTSPEGLLGALGPAADLAQQLAFPLALIVLVFAFVTVQNRLDRKDPKLALAAATPDVLNFA
jgi:hypothetical protein